jgi:glycosyltransferase involved in cell wall biosynthesis
MKILVLEPYFGGSHKRFLEDLQNLFPSHHFHFLTLPARKWKWRMRFSAPYFAEKLKTLPTDFDSLLCSTFVDVAAFRGLAPKWVSNVPICTYFHENQFAYPVQVEDERDYHFALTNLTTAASSDSVAFNSIYNLETFLSGSKEMVKKAPDMKLGIVDAIRTKSRVLHPGMNFSYLDKIKRQKQGEDLPVIVWNHRWEHDKNPEFFFETLFSLDDEGIAFKLIVLGQAFSRQPDIFNEARTRLAHRILHFGYAEKLEEYYTLLKKGTLVISTSVHEFYGMSVIEAVRAGCRALLPRRLSYPELFPADFLYEDNELGDRIKRDLLHGRLTDASAKDQTEEFSWSYLRDAYQQWLTGTDTT